MGDEDATTESMLIEVLNNVDWTFVPQDQLKREYSDVINEPDLVDALIRINP